jgi:hypothetical protein
VRPGGKERQGGRPQPGVPQRPRADRPGGAHRRPGNAVHQTLLVDPLTAPAIPPTGIHEIADEMLVAQARWPPQSPMSRWLGEHSDDDARAVVRPPAGGADDRARAGRACVARRAGAASAPRPLVDAGREPLPGAGLETDLRIPPPPAAALVRIPLESGHPFRSIPNTPSGVFEHPLRRPRRRPT